MGNDTLKAIRPAATVPTLRHFHVFLWVFFVYASTAVYSADKAGEGLDLYKVQILFFTSTAMLFSLMYILTGRAAHLLFRWPVVWLFAYAAVAFITVPFSPDAAFTFVKAGQLLSVALLAVAAGAGGRENGPERLLNATYIALIICMAVGWAVAVLRPDLGTQMYIGKAQLGRIPFHYTTLGGMASVLAAAFFVRLNDEGGMTNLLVFLFALATLLATQARMSTVYVLLVIWAVLFVYRRWGWFIACNAAGASLFAIGPVREKIFDFVYRQQTLDTLANLNGRITAWVWGLGRFRDHPIIGHGYYTGSRYLLFEGYRSLNLKQFHNDFMNILFNTGTLGVICVAALYASTIFYVLRLRRSGLKRVSIELTMVIFIVFATGFVHSSIGWDAWYMMFVMAAVVVTAANYRGLADSKRGEKQERA
ncbi:MAG: O-antigen ligase family protein [Deltaproteobacteria bacterium]|nr:O-antigen ligase family protein [Deltaproteobacteria bacterium]